MAPAFDVNPEPDDGHRRTSVAGESTPTGEVRALVEYAKLFGLSDARAMTVLTEVVTAMSRWRAVATTNRVTESELALFGPAIERGTAALAAMLN